MSFGVVAHGVKVVRVVGDCVAVVVRPDVVCVWLLMASGLPDRWRWCCGRCAPGCRSGVWLLMALGCTDRGGGVPNL